MIPHMLTPAVTATSISSVCPACGVMKKSGKASCCGLGGSWFGNCGSAGNANLGHTWHEGIRACETQFQAVVGERLHAYQANNNASFDSTSMGTNFKAVIVAAQMLALMSDNTSTPLRETARITVRANTSIITADRKSVGYDAGTTISTATSASKTSIAHILVNMSTILPVIGTITHRANGAIAPLANRTIINLMRSALVDIPMTTSSHKSAGTSTTTQECETLAHPVAHLIGVILTIVY